MDEKQAILGFTEFFKGITGNQNLEIPNDIAEKYGIEKPTTGHWITEDRLHPKCDQCGWEYGSSMTKFCPNCGADMRGEKC